MREYGSCHLLLKVLVAWLELSSSCFNAIWDNDLEPVCKSEVLTSFWHCWFACWFWIGDSIEILQPEIGKQRAFFYRRSTIVISIYLSNYMLFWTYRYTGECLYQPFSLEVLQRLLRVGSCGWLTSIWWCLHNSGASATWQTQLHDTSSIFSCL